MIIGRFRIVCRPEWTDRVAEAGALVGDLEWTTWEAAVTQ